MPSRFRVSVVTRTVAVAAVAAAGAAGATVVVPALASSTQHRVTSHPVVRPAEGGALLLIAPTAGRGRLSPAAKGKAVSTCVRYAARAGWPNNGYFAGDLVTAATICVAESRGDPHLKVCDDKNGHITGQGDWPIFKCPAGSVSYDRGLWQLNNVNASGTHDKCAFNPVCNAGQAYLYSGRGISFAPWSSYDQQTYATYLDLVQAAVTKLTFGTVTSALLGECLAQSKEAAGAKVDIVNCGSGAANQQWSTSGGKLRSGSRCAAIASTRGKPGVVLRRCARTKTQVWAAFGRYELRNAADHKCLTDPGSKLKAGTQVDVTACANAKNQTWWLP